MVKTGKTSGDNTRNPSSEYKSKADIEDDNIEFLMALSNGENDDVKKILRPD